MENQKTGKSNRRFEFLNTHSEFFLWIIIAIVLWLAFFNSNDTEKTIKELINYSLYGSLLLIFILIFKLVSKNYPLQFFRNLLHKKKISTHTLSFYIQSESEDYYELKNKLKNHLLKNEDYSTLENTQLLRNFIESKIQKFNLIHKENCFLQLTSFEERKGSLEIIAIIIAVGTGIQTFGGIREGIDYIRNDTKALLKSAFPHNQVSDTLIEHPSNQNTVPQTLRSRIRTFFWNFTGVNQRHLENCYEDWNSYTNLGLAVMLTGIFAGSAGGYAISLVFRDNLLIPVIFGIFWAILVMNLDVILLGTFYKFRRIRFLNFCTIFLRIIFASIIAFTISVPIEMRLFSDEIEYMTELEIEKRVGLEEKLFLTSNAGLELSKLEKRRDTAFIYYKEEMEGKGSPDKGVGKIAERLKQEKDQLEAELIIVKERNEKILKDKVSTLRANLIRNKNGFLRTFISLEQLKSSENGYAVFWASWAIKIIFLLVELMPIFAKLIRPRSPYDALIERIFTEKINKEDELRNTFEKK